MNAVATAALFGAYVLMFAVSAVNAITESPAVVHLRPVKVLAYEQGGIVTYGAAVELSAGVHTLLLTGVTDATVTNKTLRLTEDASLTFVPTPGLSILDVSHTVEHLPSHDDDRVTQVRRRLGSVVYDVSGREAQFSKVAQDLADIARRIERAVSSEMTHHGAVLTELDSANAALTFTTSELSNITQQLLSARSRVAAAADRLNELKVPTAVVKIIVSVATSSQYLINVTRLVAAVKWVPVYDVTLTTEPQSGRVRTHIRFDAVITQSTANVWRDVDVEVSTGAPTATRAVPVLEPWWLDGKAQEKVTLSADHYSHLLQAASGSENGDGDALGSLVGETSNVWRAENRHTVVPSAGCRVKLVDVVLQGSLERIATPKRSTRVFMRVRARNSAGLTFVPGQAVITFDGAFVGGVAIGIVPPRAMMTLDVGTDAAMRVYRVEHKQKFTNPGGLFSTDTPGVSVRVTTKVVNHGQDDVMVRIQDQLPLAMDDKTLVVLSTPKPVGGPTVLTTKLWALAFEAGSNATLSSTGVVEWTAFSARQRITDVPLDFDVTWKQGARAVSPDEL